MGDDNLDPRGANRLGVNPYGYYDADAREYVVTRPDTPTPWMNYLGMGRYGGIISNTAGGFSFDRDPRDRRVSRYRYNSLPVDQPGRYVYLRRKDTGEFWGATWQPVRAPLEGYECRHGAGYTRITTERAGVRAEALYFVPPTPPGDPCPAELWVVRLVNTTGKSLTVQTFSYVEFSYVSAPNDLHNLDWAGHIVSSRYDEAHFAIVAGTKFQDTRVFFASDRKPKGYDCDREAFVGPYRGLEAPEVVERGRSRRSESARGNSIGSLCHEIRLAPGRAARIVYALGITDTPGAIGEVIARYRDPAAVAGAFAALGADWEGYLGAFRVATPDADADATVNYLAPLQCRTALYWSRFVSGYETGLGRGMGTRDTAQDTFGVVHAAPGEVASRLARGWGMQFADGHAWHQYFPLADEGGPGLAAERPDRPQWFCDDHLWLVLATCNYLKETGDYGFLRRRVRFVTEEPGRGGDGPVRPTPVPDDTIWGHMLAAVDFTLSHRGPHGLPRSGYADWDDTLNADHGSGRAESVWCGMQFCRVALDLAELAEHLRRPAEVARFTDLHDEMARAINGCAWDGLWYARCFDDAGEPIGVSSETRHRINLIPQSWSVIGEVAPPERALLAMDSAHNMLDTPYGPSLLWPPYDGGDERVNGTSTFPPGAKENGGIFCHAAAWSVIAAAQLGDGDRAYGYYRQLLPLSRPDVDRAAVEPYVYCQNVCGPAHPQYGLGRNSWLTGAAAWMYVAVTQWILGIRPTHSGLRVAPAIPSGWSGFVAWRRFRGTTYEITVTRQGPGDTVLLVVDGRSIPGDVVPLPTRRKSHVVVEATLGG
ncbi:MAG: GH36-type glycosyl hydrolase domain-containing protein [Acidimicrobiales bacterium]